MAREAFVTVATTDDYAIGSLVVAEGLLRGGTTRELVVLITENVSLFTRNLLASVYNEVILVSHPEGLNCGNVTKPNLQATFVKLHAWRLVQYRKCVFLDSDTLVLQSCDELFDWPELSAAPDVGWPDCFNSGVFVFEPSLKTYAALVELANQEGSFDGADQGLLNTYFKAWHTDIAYRLPFIYNMVASITYTYAPAFKYYGSSAKIVHFLGPLKPWSLKWKTDSSRFEGETNPFLGQWLEIFDKKILPNLPTTVHNFVSSQSTTTTSQAVSIANDASIRSYWSKSQPLEDMHMENIFDHTEWIQMHAAPLTQWEPPMLVHWDHPSTSQWTPPSHHHYAPQESQPFSQSPSPFDPNENYISEWHSHDESISHQEEVPIHYPHALPPVEIPADPHWESLHWHTPETYWQPPNSQTLRHKESMASETFREPHSPPRSILNDSAASNVSRELVASVDAREMSSTRNLGSLTLEPSIQYTQAMQQHSNKSANGYRSSGSIINEPLTVSNQREIPTSNLPCDQAVPENAIQQELNESLSIYPYEGNEIQGIPEDEYSRMRDWEEGRIDYLGKDSFINIWKRIQMSIFPEPELTEIALELSNMEESEISVGTDDDYLQDEIGTSAGELPGNPIGDFTGMKEWEEGRDLGESWLSSDKIMRRLDLFISGTIETTKSSVPQVEVTT